MHLLQQQIKFPKRREAKIKLRWGGALCSLWRPRRRRVGKRRRQRRFHQDCADEQVMRVLTIETKCKLYAAVPSQEHPCEPTQNQSQTESKEEKGNQAIETVVAKCTVREMEALSNFTLFLRMQALDEGGDV